MRPDRRAMRLLLWARRHRTGLAIFGTGLVLLLAAIALWAILRELTWAEVRTALGAMSARQVLAAIILTMASYFTLTFYDVLALQAIGRPLPWWRAALGSFTAYCFSHNLGFAPVTGGAARWRAYAGTGLSAADIARIVVIAGATFWLGILLMFAFFMLTMPGAARFRDMALPYPVQASIGGAMLLAIVAYLVACALRLGPIRILGWSLPVPSLKQAMAQFALAATDISIASAALLVLLPGSPWDLFGAFLVAYVIAMVIAFATHAPGGLGVFEAAILVTLPQVDQAGLVSALIVYRLIYFWIPLGLAILLLGGREAFRFAETPFRLDKGEDG